MKNTGKWLNRLQNQTRSGNIHGKVTKQTVTKDIITSMIHSLLFKSYNLVQYVQNKHKCGQQLFRIYSSLYIFKRKKIQRKKIYHFVRWIKKKIAHFLWCCTRDTLEKITDGFSYYFWLSTFSSFVTSFLVQSAIKVLY